MAALPVTPLPPPVPQAAPLSEGARLANVFFAPRKTFTDLRRNASWWAPFLLMAVVAIAFAYAVDSRVGFRQAVENQVQRSPKASQRLEEMPPDQREQRLRGQASGTRYFMYGFPLVTLIIFAVLAAIYLGIFKFGANADLTYGRTFAVLIYAALPEMLRGVLAIVSLFAGVSPDGFNLQNPIATNLGYFLQPANSPFLYGIASALDIFRIWVLVVTALGFAYAGKVKKSTSFAIVFGLFVILTLLFSGLGAMAS
jgi:Yip1 domain